VCKNGQELEPCYEKENFGHGASAMFMKRRAPDLEQCHFYDGSTALDMSA